MSHRFAIALVSVLAAGMVAACAGAPPAPSSGAPAPTPGLTPPAPATPDVSEATSAEPTATRSPDGPDAGNVEERPLGPELSVESVNATTIRATIEDRDAKAWRIVVSGSGVLANDRLEVVVETGDVAPLITATEVRDGKVVSVIDLSEFGDPTAAAGGCHATLGVCIDSDGFSLPSDGDGTLVVELHRLDGASLLSVAGGTASWPGEPFILGPWTDTDAFPWDPGVSF